jgi:hypothetical protein
MAGPGLTAKVTMMVDEPSKAQLIAAFKSAGEQGMAALKQAFDLRMADLRNNLARGIIDPNQFKQLSDEAGTAFNAAILTKIKELGTAGQLTTGEYVKLTSQLKTVGEEGGRSVGLLQQGWDKFKTFLTGLGTTILATFAVRNIVDFATSSIKMAADQQVAWTQYDQTLKNVGTSLAAMHTQIADAITYVQTHSVFDDDAAIAGLTSLTRATGDAQLALQALPVAMELAAAKHKTLEEASDALGRALGPSGNTGILQRWGIAIDASQPILEQLRTKLAGLAENELNSFDGQLAKLNVGWDDFKKAIGGALIEAGTQSGVLQTINGYLQQGIEWVNQHKEAIAGWLKVFVDFAVEGIKVFGSMLAGTARDIENFAFMFEDLKLKAELAWHTILEGLAGFAIKLNEFDIKVLEFAAKAADALGMDTLAKNLRAAADSSKATVSELSTFQRDQAGLVDQANNQLAANQRAYSAATAAAVKADAVAEGEAIGTETGKGVDVATGHLDRFAKGYVAVISTISTGTAQFWTQDLPAQIDQATAQAETNWKSWADDVTTYLNKKSQEQADAAVAAQFKAIDLTNEKERSAREEQIRLEQAKLQTILDDTNATEEQKRAAFEKTSALQQELDVITATKAGEEFRRSTAEGKAATDDYNQHFKSATDEREAKAREEVDKHLGGLQEILNKISNEWVPGLQGVISALGLSNTAVGSRCSTPLDRWPPQSGVSSALPETWALPLCPATGWEH